MGKLNRLLVAFFCVCVLNTVQSQINNVPIFMWNLNTEVLVNPLQTINSGNLADQLAQSLHNRLVVVFMQDELSIEDLKSEDLASIKAMADSSNEGTFYAPSISNPENFPTKLEGKGFRLINVKSHEDLPKGAMKEKTVLVIQLPSTWSEGSRSESLQLNGNVVTEVFEALKSQHPEVVGILTGKKNSQSLKSHIRVTREVDSNAVDRLYNISDGKAFLFIENAPMLIYQEGSTGINFTLKEDPVTTKSVVNDTAATIVLEYNGAIGTDGAVLTEGKITLTFGLTIGYWEMQSASVNLVITPKGPASPITVNVPEMKTADVVAPLTFSYHCTPTTNLISFGFGNSTVGQSVRLQMNGFQLQPFGISQNRFGNWYDCQGFFTEGIWAGILLGLVIAMMLAWAIGMLADVKTPDRFDDPKGKTITITATD